MRTRWGCIVFLISIGIVIALIRGRDVKEIPFENTMEPIPISPPGIIPPPPVSSPPVQEGEPKTGETRTFADIEFVWIPPGSFQMGSPAGDEDLINNELPQHPVTIPQGFWMGKYEITQGQWEKVMGNNPSFFKNTRKPVENISWDDCQEFIKKMNALEKGTFRLPSEAEWEYACRAGSTTKFYFGDHSLMAIKHMWYRSNSFDTTHPVGQLAPNAWGLYDMHGNVLEYCQDCYHDNYTGAPNDGRAWESLPSKTMILGGQTIEASADEMKVVRGGSWFNRPRACRSPFRSVISAGHVTERNGFRLVRNP